MPPHLERLLRDCHCQEENVAHVSTEEWQRGACGWEGRGQEKEEGDGRGKKGGEKGELREEEGRREKKKGKREERIEVKLGEYPPPLLTYKHTLV